MTTTTERPRGPRLSDIADRPRLLSLLHGAGESDLVVLDGPPGYGKTALIRQWSDRVESRHVAWLDLGDPHRQPEAFVAALAAAIQQVRPWHSIEPESIAGERPLDLIDLLVERSSSKDSALVVVFDGADVLADSEGADMLAHWLADAPSQRCDVLIGRRDPTPANYNVGARPTVRISSEDLRFDESEIRSVVEGATRRSTRASEVSEILEFAAGWPLAAAFVSNCLRSVGDGSLDDALTEARQLCEEYLRNEVLDGFPPRQLWQLQELSVLQPFHVDLASSALAGEGVSQLVHRLIGENLFVRRIAGSGNWYELHPILQSLLRRDLERRDPGRSQAIARRASVWFRTRGASGEAARYAVVARDSALASEILEESGLGLANQIELDGLLALLESGGLSTQNRLAPTKAWALALSGRLGTATNCALEILENGDDIYNDSQRGVAHLTLAYVAGMSVDVDKSRDHCNQAIELLPEDAHEAHAFANLLLGITHRISGDLAETERCFARCLALSQEAGSPQLTIDALWERALLEEMQGRPGAAVATCEVGMKIAVDEADRTGVMVASSAYLTERKAALLLATGRLEQALRLARQAVADSSVWGHADSLVVSRLTLARVLLRLGRRSEAFEQLEQASVVAASLGAWYERSIARERLRFALRTGHSTLARTLISDFEIPEASEASLLDLQHSLLPLGALLSIGKADVVRSAAAGYVRAFEELGVWDAVLRCNVLLAVASQQLGDLAGARSAIDRALRLGAPEGYVEVFLQHPEEMRGLLADAAQRGVSPQHCRSLLMAMGAEDVDLIETPTRRELEVLNALASGMSVDEIADDLFISPSTVRSHVKSLYRKLGVNRRSGAVARGRELNLILS